MYTLIIADDEFELRQSLRHTMDWESIGFRVVGEAENGIEALELVEKLEPDLLLTDIKMPFLNGIELAREVRAIRPAMNIAFLSGYDDFSYAQQAIHYNIISYILKPISAGELKEEMLKIKEKMDRKREELVQGERPQGAEQMQESYEKRLFLYSLLFESGRRDTDGEEQGYFDRMSLTSGIRKFEGEKQDYILQVAKFCDEEGKNRTVNEQLRLFDSVIGKYVGCINIFAGNRIISLAAAQSRDIKKYMTIFPKEISQIAKRYMGLRAVIGLSSQYDGLENSYYAYMEAMDAMEYAGREESGISIFSDYEKLNAEQQFHSNKIADELMHTIKTETEENLIAYIENVFREMKHNSRLVTSQMMVAIYETINNLLGEEAAAGLLSTFYEGDEQFAQLIKKQSRTELTRLALKARNLIQEQRQANSKLLCDEAMKIIDSEYGQEELSLAQVSERLHVSVSYLSTLMKKVCGKSFITLLTEKRMLAARERILYSQKKMLEIAQECGYSDNHYFSYSFKKYFGVSPRKMRETIQNEEK